MSLFHRAPAAQGASLALPHPLHQLQGGIPTAIFGTAAQQRVHGDGVQPGHQAIYGDFKTTIYL